MRDWCAASKERYSKQNQMVGYAHGRSRGDEEFGDFDRAVGRTEMTDRQTDVAHNRPRLLLCFWDMPPHLVLVTIGCCASGNNSSDL